MTWSILFRSQKEKTNLNKREKQSLKLALFSTFLHLSFGLSLPILTINKVSAAEKIFLNFGPLQFSLSVKSLENYAETGEIDSSLKGYTKFLNDEQIAQLQTILATNADISPLSIAQFFYSYQGERILEKIGQVIQTKSGQSGFYGIRSALIMAAADEEGLTALNFLKKFPTEVIRINSERGFEIIEELSSIIQETNEVIAKAEQEAFAETLNSTVVDVTPPPDLSQPGSIAFGQQVYTLEDESRDRTFPVTVYLPELSVDDDPLPLVVISHGLGSDRSTFAYLAEHLASYGFAVAVPEHPGSNAAQIENLLEGFASDVTPPEEFIDRPLDISYLLDQLAVIYQGQIDTDEVGIVGQSFGGYTALALAGAQLNFSHLETECESLGESFNLSLLLQCLALESEQKTVNLEDERISTAIAINPLTSAIFGEAGIAKIEIPVMIVSGSADPVTPALPEQIEPFTWLETTEKYLVLLRGGTHFSFLDETSGAVPVPKAAIGPDPQIAQTYLQQLGLVFFSAYITDDVEYFGYLNADYGEQISNPSLPLSLLRSLESFSQLQDEE
ncbi:MAG TPA: alpha/beta hydrolase [Xenococcaceae cyanobacterium]